MHELGGFGVIRRARSHLTYANVVATAAVFIALGGTSYAVVSLPRNSVGQRELKAKSVGSSEIRTGAVRSKDIHNGSIALRDISTATKRSLRGKQGPAGAPGPPGTAAVSMGSAVTAAGEVINGTGGASHGVTGVYQVEYDKVNGPGVQDLSNCRAVASLSSAARNGSQPPIAPNGEIVTEPTTQGVTVHTYDSAGSPKDLPFHLIVVC